MKLKRKLLNESGYTLIELVIVILLIAVAIGPIYNMIVSSAKIQKTSEETYQATLQAQGLLESVRGQIEEDLGDQYKIKRGVDPTVDPDVDPEKSWLTPPAALPGVGSPPDLLLNFLNDVDVLTTPIDAANGDILKMRKDFKTDAFLYEVHIWHLENGEIQPIPTSIVEYDKDANPSVAPPKFTDEIPADFTMVEIKDAIKEYFDHKEDALLWTKPIDLSAPGDKEPKAVGVISYDATKVATDGIKLEGSGMKSTTPSSLIDPIDGYEGALNTEKLAKKTNVDYGKYDDTYEFVISQVVGEQLEEKDFIYLSMDLATFPAPPPPPVTTPPTDPNINEKRVIRIENKTKATVVVPMYNEKEFDIKIYPIQHKTGGNIILERRDKREPQKNFVIGIVVRDAFNSTFGEPHKILSKIVDVYSYDYNKK